VRPDLPSGTVTFLFTDVEGSTRLLHELGAETYAEVLGEHRRLLRDACSAHGGVEVDTQGDAFFFAFSTAPGALAAAASFTETLAPGPIHVRVGMHTGTPLVTEEGYVGGDVHRAARIAAAGHGGQVLVSASTAALADGDGLRDLGEHRLKDLSAPERIYQLGDGEFPALKSLYRTNLPVPGTPFLGRERELAEVVELVTKEGLRFLTLTGPGGTGKTRLALQVAAEASEAFPDGVFWVPLATLRDPELVLPSVARALAVSDEPDTPIEETLVSYLSGKTLLLVLDNVEHLLPPAAERIAALRATNGSSLLVTSRERLRIGGEQSWPVPPLAAVDGTELFLARARAIDLSFMPSPAVDELCARLDELPLAIELAAARTAVFSAEQLLERMSHRLDLLIGDRGADPRQQTLRATIEWSHDLLTAKEQRLLARLAVFVGGCTYEAAEHVAGAEPDTLQSLLDKSLLRKRDTTLGPRYWMLETIREYAVERLQDSGEAEAGRRRHADHYLTLAEDAYPHLTGSPKAWLMRLEAEHDNLRAACDRLEAAGKTQLVLRVAGALWKFWYARGYRAEGLRRLERALVADDSATAARALALSGATAMAAELGHLEQALSWGTEALALHSELGDAWGVANSIFILGNLDAYQRDWAMARIRFEESLDLFTDLGDEHYSLLSAACLAWMYEALGDMERGRALTEDTVARARALGNLRIEAFSLQGLAFHIREEGRFDDALDLMRDAYRIHRELGQRSEIADAISVCARIHAAAGRSHSAVRLLSSADAHYDELGVRPPPYVADRNAETEAIVRTQLDEDAFRRVWDEGRTLSADEAIALGLDEIA
jgi:predicted ATPase/class 3 adenylate cyclase